jgi:hypothetical protein
MIFVEKIASTCAELSILDGKNYMKKLIFSFWDYSLGKSNSFDFDLFFKTFIPILKYKLASHCQLTFKKYIETLCDIYNFSELGQFVYKSEHTGASFDYNSIIRRIFYPRYVHFRKYFSRNSNYTKLLQLCKELKNYSKLNHFEKVFLVDKCIYSMHNSGLLLNIDDLRKEYEN